MYQTGDRSRESMVLRSICALCSSASDDAEVAVSIHFVL